MTRYVRSLTGSSRIPSPLGRSCDAKTIVWEEAEGERLDNLAKRSWLTGRTGESVGRALLHAGKWVRDLHDSSAHGTQVIEMRRAIQNLEMRMLGKEIAEQRYIESAIQILNHLIAVAGTSRFTMPVALAHGDFCPANLMWEKNSQSLTVVDFELSEVHPVCYDLFALVSDLRARLLVPLIPKATIRHWEESFWTGYGPVAIETRMLVDALALARIFYHHLPRLLTRRKRRGQVAGLAAFAYRTLAERLVITYRIDLPSKLKEFVLGRKASYPGFSH